MKKSVLFILLASLGGAATAANPNGAWLEFYGGKMKADELPAGTLDDDGKVRGFAASIPFSSNAYFRGDWRQERFDYSLDLDNEPFENNREVSSITIGMVEVMSAELRMFGEIGAARVEREHLLGAADPGFAASKTTPMLRVGLTGEDGRFSWYLAGEWLDKALQPDFTEESERWWNVYLGYQLTSRLELGVRYADNEEFRNTSASLRIRF